MPKINSLFKSILLFAVGLLLALLLVLLISQTIWAHYDRVDQVQVPFDAKLVDIQSHGTNVEKGNLLGIQPWLATSDYTNTATLTAKFSSYLMAAREQGWLSEKTVVAFPEYTGTWLVATGEKKSIYSERKSDDAMTTVALTHLPEFTYRLLTAPAVHDKAKWAIFSVKAKQAAKDYQAVFGELSHRFGVNIVAGSILLPEPQLVNGELVVTPGKRLFNVSAVFGPDGHIIPPLVIKVFPILDELEFIDTGKTASLPVFDTKAGKLGVLICADAWYPENYVALKKSGADMVVVPSYSAHDRVWSTLWGGYNGGAQPADVDSRDIGKITEGDAWMKYAIPQRTQAAGIKAGMNVFLRGELWDLGSDGATIRVSGTDTGKENVVQGATLTNLWLN